MPWGPQGGKHEGVAQSGPVHSTVHWQTPESVHSPWPGKHTASHWGVTRMEKESTELSQIVEEVVEVVEKDEVAEVEVVEVVVEEVDAEQSAN